MKLKHWKRIRVAKDNLSYQAQDGVLYSKIRNNCLAIQNLKSPKHITCLLL